MSEVKIWANSGDSHSLGERAVWDEILPKHLAHRMPRSERHDEDGYEIVRIDGQQFRREFPKLNVKRDPVHGHPHLEGTFGHSQKTLHELFDGVDSEVSQRTRLDTFNELFPQVPAPRFMGQRKPPSWQPCAGSLAFYGSQQLRINAVVPGSIITPILWLGQTHRRPSHSPISQSLVGSVSP